MKRRAVCLFPALAIAPPLSAQPKPRMQRIGRLATGTPNPSAAPILAQNEGLREQGLIEGQNIESVWRWASGPLDTLPGLAAELVAERVDVILTGTNNATAAAMRATSTIPIVMVMGTDPVRNGLIDSYARPGRNVTGLSADAGQQMHGKHLDLLKALVPGLRRVAVLVQEGLGEDAAAIDEAARSLGMQLVAVPKVTRPEDIEPTFAAMKRGGAQAYLGIGGSVLFVRSEQVAAIALQYRLPGVHWLSTWVRNGALVSYGPHINALFKRSGWYVARILQGAKPADLPVEQPSRFEMAINLKTAKALGLAVPQSLLLRADEVIE
jgi:putative tryptophan/tyrosine transport system substrate-binding protein